jgi:hypothetical protein
MAGVPYVSGSVAAETLKAKIAAVGEGLKGTLHGSLTNRISSAGSAALGGLGLASPQVSAGVSDALQAVGVHSAQAGVYGDLAEAGTGMLSSSGAKTVAAGLLRLGLRQGVARAGAAAANLKSFGQAVLPVIQGQAERAVHAGGEALDALHAAAMRSGPAPGMAGTITIDHRNADTPVASLNPRALFKNKEVVRQTQMDKASQGPQPQAN